LSPVEDSAPKNNYSTENEKYADPNLSPPYLLQKPKEKKRE
jgi:hypothetical protein